MLFNSYAFLYFLPIVFLLYWRVKNRHTQNLFIVLASYVFYGWWDWRFLSLLAISSVADYLLGKHLALTEVPARRRWLLYFSLLINLGILGFFKYFNFFIDTAALALESLGLQAHLPTLRIILPVGISFYTFQTLSYTLDIYRRKMEPTTDLVAFLAFVSFFPQLVAGPIERARQLLPQFQQPRRFDMQQATDGLRQILWGFFKKVVVADQCATIVDYCFQTHATLNWWSHGVGIVFFAFQIYGDFSGYSDIAIGIARLLGFKLMRNFAYPYFSRDIAEFWRRWHISLSTWFRDYVYIPLGGSRMRQAGRIRNILITFTVSGLWHGANWTFVFWGFLNGLYYIPLMLTRQHKRHTEIVAQHAVLPTLREVSQVALTFILTCVAWVFFRADNMGEAWSFILGMSGIAQGTAAITTGKLVPFFTGFLGILVIVVAEWIQRHREHALEHLPQSRYVRWLLYLALALAVINFFGAQKTFIYFQF